MYTPRVLYSWKYWWELNLVVEPQITIPTHWWDLNLVVWYRIAIWYICEEEILADFNLVV